MLLRAATLLICCFLFASTAHPQKPVGFKQPRILILLDGSSSMTNAWQAGQTRFQTAGNIVLALMDSIYNINPDVEFSLRVYGHQSPAAQNDCYDTRKEVLFSKSNRTQMAFRLESLQPIGVSPIAYSLKAAAESDFENDHDYSYSLILITDGGESCGGDVCAIVQNLVRRKIEFNPYIISLFDYAPLRDQYNCLGSYLLVSQTTDLPRAVKTIAEGYRINLASPIPKGAQQSKSILESDTTPKPGAAILVPIRMEKVEIAYLKARQPVMIGVAKLFIQRPSRIGAPTIAIPQAIVEDVNLVRDTFPLIASRNTFSLLLVKPTASKVARKPLPQITYPERIEEPIVLLKTEIVAIPFKKLRPVSAKTSEIVKADKKPIPTISYPEKLEEVVIAKQEIPAIVSQRRLRMQQYFYVIPKKPRISIPPINYPERKADSEPAVIAAPTRAKPVNQANKSSQEPELTEAAYITESQPASKTTLQLYFTNGKGRYYQTTPRIVLLDAKTNQEVKRFTRWVDANGNPDPQEIPPGIYTVTFDANRSLVARNVQINAAENKKVTITVTNGTLRFEYEPNTKRPISEFTAVVKRNFEYAPTVQQPCAEPHAYEPGNYHIEINTLPQDRRNIDLDFGATYYIRINEPGWVQFTNQQPVGKVSLYYPLGDQFARFYTIDISGRPDSQKLRLQPNTYRAVYIGADGAEAMKVFRIKSNETTNLEL